MECFKQNGRGTGIFSLIIRKISCDHAGLIDALCSALVMSDTDALESANTNLFSEGDIPSFLTLNTLLADSSSSNASTLILAYEVLQNLPEWKPQTAFRLDHFHRITPIIHRLCGSELHLDINVENFNHYHESYSSILDEKENLLAMAVILKRNHYKVYTSVQNVQADKPIPCEAVGSVLESQNAFKENVLLINVCGSVFDTSLNKALEVMNLDKVEVWTLTRP